MVARARRILPALSALPLCLQGCYFLELYLAQKDLLSRARPLEQVLSDDAVAEEAKDKLRYVQEVKAYAEASIGLRKTRNYSSYLDVGSEPVSWTVAACRSDRFEPIRWNYPLIGAATYKGFFDREEAEREADAQRRKGQEVRVNPVAAYSTLGYFSDPITTRFLSYDRAGLADLVIHELVHAHLYVPGHTAFNESLASFVAWRGAGAYLAERFGPDSQEVAAHRIAQARRDEWMRLIDLAHGALDALYRSGLGRTEILARKEEILQALQSECAARLGGAVALDNLTILASRDYYRTDWWTRAFEAVGEDWRALFGLARRAGGARDPFLELERLLRKRPALTPGD